MQPLPECAQVLPPRGLVLCRHVAMPRRIDDEAVAHTEPVDEIVNDDRLRRDAFARRAIDDSNLGERFEKVRFEREPAWSTARGELAHEAPWAVLLDQAVQ